MRLLGWMHCKLKQTSNESLKDFPIGQPLLGNRQYHRKSNYGTRPLCKAERDNCHRKSFTSLEATRVEEEDCEEESSAAISELFHGFLNIGTLGSDTVITDPPIPIFPISDNITEKETEVTEDELKLISYELETVLEAEGKEDGCNESSGRNSHVNTGRSSHASTITLSGKPNKSAETNGSGTIRSLQDCVSGSAIELPETTVAKKEHRVSLGELFQRTNTEENFSGAKSERGEKRTEKETDKSAVHLMKKMLKRRMFPASTRSSNVAATGGNVDSNSMETKMHKILHMFNRKVHPESLTGEYQKYDEPHEEIKNNFTYEGGCANGDQFYPDEDIIIIPQRAISKVSIRRFKSKSNPPQVTLSRSDSNGNREYWIKTDADYLVLEL